jgi:hypothetical protein
VLPNSPLSHCVILALFRQTLGNPHPSPNSRQHTASLAVVCCRTHFADFRYCHVGCHPVATVQQCFSSAYALTDFNPVTRTIFIGKNKDYSRNKWEWCPALVASKCSFTNDNPCLQPLSSHPSCILWMDKGLCNVKSSHFCFFSKSSCLTRSEIDKLFSTGDEVDRER